MNGIEKLAFSLATEQALAILRAMNENRESFRKIGLTFEEKVFHDILISMRGWC